MISVKFVNECSRAFCLAFIGFFFWSTNLKSQEVKSIKQSEWKGYVREFRGNHNFSLVGGNGRSLWTISPGYGEEEIRGENRSIFAKIQYAFHIPLWRGVGYFLGSSIGAIVQKSEPADPLKSDPIYMLPGILAGGVVNFSPEFRAGLGADYYMERVNALQWKGSEGDGYPYKLDMTMVSQLDFLAFMDLFYTINMSIRIEYHKRNMEYSKPSSQYKDKVVDAKINRKDSWIGLGLAYHLL